jgi:hypothetical protein
MATETLIAPKQLAPSAATETELYDCPDATTFAGTLRMVNRSGTPTQIRVRVKVANAADDDKQWLWYDHTIGGYERIDDSGIVLGADDRLKVYNLLATVTFTLMGVQRA